ncbi:ankyrin repeat domain-containing protein [bacterium]|nr:ankyrin repeat domain-containing protein [bacterium]
MYVDVDPTLRDIISGLLRQASPETIMEVTNHVTRLADQTINPFSSQTVRQRRIRLLRQIAAVTGERDIDRFLWRVLSAYQENTIDLSVLITLIDPTRLSDDERYERTNQTTSKLISALRDEDKSRCDFWIANGADVRLALKRTVAGRMYEQAVYLLENYDADPNQEISRLILNKNRENVQALTSLLMNVICDPEKEKPGRKRLIKTMLSHGADPDTGARGIGEDSTKISPLEGAIKGNEIQVVVELLAHHARVAPEMLFMTDNPLILAFLLETADNVWQENWRERVQKEQIRNVFLSKQQRRRGTRYQSIQQIEKKVPDPYYRVRVIQEFIQERVYPTLKEDLHDTRRLLERCRELRLSPLGVLIHYGEKDEINRLLRNYPSEIRGIDEATGDTAIHHAARAGDPETFRRLLEHGYDPRVKNKRGLNNLSDGTFLNKVFQLPEDTRMTVLLDDDEIFLGTPPWGIYYLAKRENKKTLTEEMGYFFLPDGNMIHRLDSNRFVVATDGVRVCYKNFKGSFVLRPTLRETLEANKHLRVSYFQEIMDEREYIGSITALSARTEDDVLRKMIGDYLYDHERAYLFQQIRDGRHDTDAVAFFDEFHHDTSIYTMIELLAALIGRLFARGDYTRLRGLYEKRVSAFMEQNAKLGLAQTEDIFPVVNTFNRLFRDPREQRSYDLKIEKEISKEIKKNHYLFDFNKTEMVAAALEFVSGKDLDFLIERINETIRHDPQQIDKARYQQIQKQVMKIDGIDVKNTMTILWQERISDQDFYDTTTIPKRIQKVLSRNKVYDLSSKILKDIRFPEELIGRALFFIAAVLNHERNLPDTHDELRRYIEEHREEIIAGSQNDIVLPRIPVPIPGFVRERWRKEILLRRFFLMETAPDLSEAMFIYAPSITSLEERRRYIERITNPEWHGRARVALAAELAALRRRYEQNSLDKRDVAQNTKALAKIVATRSVDDLLTALRQQPKSHRPFLLQALSMKPSTELKDVSAQIRKQIAGQEQDTYLKLFLDPLLQAVEAKDPQAIRRRLQQLDASRIRHTKQWELILESARKDKDARPVFERAGHLPPPIPIRDIIDQCRDSFERDLYEIFTQTFLIRHNEKKDCLVDVLVSRAQRCLGDATVGAEDANEKRRGILASWGWSDEPKTSVIGDILTIVTSRNRKERDTAKDNLFRTIPFFTQIADNEKERLRAQPVSKEKVREWLWDQLQACVYGAAATEQKRQALCYLQRWNPDAAPRPLPEIRRRLKADDAVYDTRFSQFRDTILKKITDRQERRQALRKFVLAFQRRQATVGQQQKQPQQQQPPQQQQQQKQQQQPPPQQPAGETILAASWNILSPELDPSMPPQEQRIARIARITEKLEILAGIYGIILLQELPADPATVDMILGDTRKTHSLYLQEYNGDFGGERRKSHLGILVRKNDFGVIRDRQARVLKALGREDTFLVQQAVPMPGTVFASAEGEIASRNVMGVLLRRGDQFLIVLNVHLTRPPPRGSDIILRNNLKQQVKEKMDYFTDVVRRRQQQQKTAHRPVPLLLGGDMNRPVRDSTLWLLSGGEAHGADKTAIDGFVTRGLDGCEFSSDKTVLEEHTSDHPIVFLQFILP